MLVAARENNRKQFPNTSSTPSFQNKQNEKDFGSITEEMIKPFRQNTLNQEI